MSDLGTMLNDRGFLNPKMQTALVFAARYTHHRNTGGTLAVVTALKTCWSLLDVYTQEQILFESYEATVNKEEWEELRKFAHTQSITGNQDERTGTR